ncbi:TauD/TfdA family dioxygenase [Pseudomonas sp. GCM10022186]|uniref:TauD/TfdA family dioxygenase n=1 Tax=Pseudomonas sp. GCM10022186 TaxID=3252650 RepID=UPI0036235407
MKNQDIGEALVSTGWAVLTSHDVTLDELQDRVYSIALELGPIRASRKRRGLVDHLRPTNTWAANPRSLSAVYGTGEFPWHTDGAHWPVPPRYLVIACAQASPAAATTFVWDARQCESINSAIASRAVFRISNGARSFYSTATSSLRPYYRYDPGCMSPMDSAAKVLQEAIEQEGASVTSQITWKPGLIAIIDNWRCLHRRANAGQDSTRYLLRSTVMG